MTEDPPAETEREESMSEIQKLATKARDEFLSAYRNYGGGNVWDNHGDELAHLNHLAEGDTVDVKLRLIESLIDSCGKINMAAPDHVGNLAPTEELRGLAEKNDEDSSHTCSELNGPQSV